MADVFITTADYVNNILIKTETNSQKSIKNCQQNAQLGITNKFLNGASAGVSCCCCVEKIEEDIICCLNGLKDREMKDRLKDCTDNNEVARNRWKILASAVNKTKRINKLEKNSLKNCVSSFDLITSLKLENRTGEESDEVWYQYSTLIKETNFQLKICHLNKVFTAQELIGFNNTGNICVWPSEEILTYYLMNNIELLRNRSLLELGGGMTCLAGIMLAKYGSMKNVLVTDGNQLSVKNVNKIIKKNNLETNVTSALLNWKKFHQIENKFDIILSADCLFFDEARNDLADTIWHCLKDDGVAFVMAPKRGDTFEKFVSLCLHKGFHCILRFYYDELVWKKHLSLKQTNNSYNEHIHYPLLLILSKLSV